MKHTIFLLTMLIAITSLNSCRTCDNEVPRISLKNKASNTANVDIVKSNKKTSSKSIASGSSLKLLYLSTGNVRLNASIVGGSTFTKTFTATSCFDYEATINNNSVTITSSDRNDPTNNSCNCN